MMKRSMAWPLLRGFVHVSKQLRDVTEILGADKSITKFGTASAVVCLSLATDSVDHPYKLYEDTLKTRVVALGSPVHVYTHGPFSTNVILSSMTSVYGLAPFSDDIDTLYFVMGDPPEFGWSHVIFILLRPITSTDGLAIVDGSEPPTEIAVDMMDGKLHPSALRAVMMK